MTTTDLTTSSSPVTSTAQITIAETTTVVETVPTALSGSENTPISLSAISVSDAPNTGDTLQTVLEVAHGTITVAAVKA